MFVSIRRKPAEDGYFLSTSANCNGQIFRQEAKIPDEDVIVWLSHQVELQREGVATSVFDWLRSEINSEAG